MPSIPVKDAGGNTVTVQTLPAVGQAAAAASLPVALPSDMPPLPVTATALPLPIGAATDASLAAVGTALATQHTDLVTLHTDVGTTLHSDMVTLHADIGTTVHGDLTGISGKLPATLGPKTGATSLSTTPASDALYPIAPPPVAYTNISGTIAAGGTAQNIVPASAGRRGWMIKNTSTASLWFDFGVAAVAGAPSLELKPGETYESPYGAPPSQFVSLIGATTGQTYTGKAY